MNLADLKQPIPYRWKVQTISKKKPKATCVAYIDARDAMDLLDKVCGPENWQDEYRFEGGLWLCGVSINKDKEGWVTKWDTGTAGEYEAEKSIISDSFKRACVKWGIGRFLYDMDIEYVDTNKVGPGAYPIFPHSQDRIWDLTEYINSKQKHKKVNDESATV